jgi:hypothetical protein
MDVRTLLELLIGAVGLLICIAFYSSHWINKRLAAIYCEVALLRLHFAPGPKHEVDDWDTYGQNLEDQKRSLRSPGGL